MAGLVRRLLLALVAPVALAILIDRLAGTEPLFTVAVALICIPLSSVLVSRAALRDMDRIIAVVAPPDDVSDTVAGDEGDAAMQDPARAASTDPQV